MSMSSKTTPFSFELFSFVKPIAVLIEKNLDLSPTYHGSTGFKKHLPSQVPAYKKTTLVGPKRKFKKFVLTRLTCVETFRC